MDVHLDFIFKPVYGRIYVVKLRTHAQSFTLSKLLRVRLVCLASTPIYGLKTELCNLRAKMRNAQCAFKIYVILSVRFNVLLSAIYFMSS